MHDYFPHKRKIGTLITFLDFTVFINAHISFKFVGLYLMQHIHINKYTLS